MFVDFRWIQLVFQWISAGFSMDFSLFFNGFQLVFVCFLCRLLLVFAVSAGFSMDFRWFFNGFQLVFVWFFMSFWSLAGGRFARPGPPPWREGPPPRPGAEAGGF